METIEHARLVAGQRCTSPDWWLGTEEAWTALRRLRMDIFRFDQKSRRVFRASLIGALISGGGAANVATAYAMVAMPQPVPVITLTAVAVFCAYVAIYGCNSRSANMQPCARLWGMLVAAVQRGDVHRGGLVGPLGPEDFLERLIRNEAALAVECVEAHGRLVSDLKCFGDLCFTLRRVEDVSYADLS